MIEPLILAVKAWGANKALDATSSLAQNYFSQSKTLFLDHDPKACNKSYQFESSLGGYLPYKEIFDFSKSIIERKIPKISIHSTKKVFFTQGKDINWAVARAQAYYAYREQGHATHDSQVVRVNEINVSDNDISMSIQPTHYFCQAESNLVLDFEACISFEKKKDDRKRITLRELLNTENPGKLPLLSDGRLANTLGVAVCLLTSDGKSTQLRMVHRAGTVGVFPNGVHPAMSCAITWPSTVESDNLMGFILSDIELEIQQEMGLHPDQYSRPVPLSLCREFLRGGKPQLFVICETKCTQQELNELRDKQVDLNKKYRADKVEMKRSGLFRTNNPIVNITGTSKFKFTHEGAACLFLVNRLSATLNSL